MLNRIQHLTIIFIVFALVIFNSSCYSLRSGFLYTVYPIEFMIEYIGGTSIQKASIQNNVVIQSANVVEDVDKLLNSSSVFFHIGDLEPYYTVSLNRIKESQIKDIDLSTMNTIYRFKRYTKINNDEGISFIEGPYYEGEAFNNIDVDQFDLYLWMDPIVMISMARIIYNELVQYNPAEEINMKANLAQLEKELINLDAHYQSLAASMNNNDEEIKFVSVTPSFGSWQKAYGIGVYPIVLSKFEVLPNDAQKEAIKARILEDEVEYIVYEPNMDNDMIQLFYEFEEELNLKRVELNNISSLTENEYSLGKDYLSLMYENLQVLETMKTKRGE